jgi:hypothetical protein
MPLPLSARRAREAASALAFQAAERLSPAVHARRKATAEADEAAPEPSGWGAWIPKGIRGAWNDPKSLIESSPLISFPEVVASEFADILSGLLQSGELAKDPQIAAAFEGHEKAMAALVAAGDGWAAFAGLVGAAGFAPYIMAAQVSAWLPFVSGATAVSFLALMVNPVTLLVGIAALGWVGLGRGSSAVRSQVAARVAVILAVRGMQAPAEGLATYVNDMRRVGDLPTSSLAHLSAGASLFEVTAREGRDHARWISSAPPALPSCPIDNDGAPLATTVRGRRCRSGRGTHSGGPALPCRCHQT